jgi:hypothetical protein
VKHSFWRKAAIGAIVRHGLLLVMELSKGHSTHDGVNKHQSPRQSSEVSNGID